MREGGEGKKEPPGSERGAGGVGVEVFRSYVARRTIPVSKETRVVPSESLITTSA